MLSLMTSVRNLILAPLFLASSISFLHCSTATDGALESAQVSHPCFEQLINSENALDTFSLPYNTSVRLVCKVFVRQHSHYWVISSTIPLLSIGFRTKQLAGREENISEYIP